MAVGLDGMHYGSEGLAIAGSGGCIGINDDDDEICDQQEMSNAHHAKMPYGLIAFVTIVGAIGASAFHPVFGCFWLICMYFGWLDARKQFRESQAQKAKHYKHSAQMSYVKPFEEN